MKASRLIIIFFVASFLSCGDRGQMLHALEALEQQNRDYVPFTSDSTALALTDYFDSHGTANECMRAHYILGCTYRDMGEMPRALECYNDAAECADTTARDCDYKTLSRIYGQIATLFSIQNMPESECVAEKKAVHYSLLAKDTISAYIFKAYITATYYKQQKYDSVIFLTNEIYSDFISIGYENYAAGILPLAIYVNPERDSIAEAKRQIDLYESKSGLYKNGTLAKGKEFHYCDKGLYYMKVGIYDSAEYYLRKVLCYHDDINNLKGGYKGLYQLYMKLGVKDSALKYSALYTEWNDTSFFRNESSHLHRIQAMYDYNRNRILAEKKSAEAENTRFVLIAFLFAFFMIATLCWYAYKRAVHIRKMKYAQLNTIYHNLLVEYAMKSQQLDMKKRELAIKRQELEKLKNELSKSENINSEFVAVNEKLISDIENLKSEINNLADKIASFHDDKVRPEKWHLPKAITESKTYFDFRNMATAQLAASMSEWNELISLMESHESDFMTKLYASCSTLKRRDIYVCCLIRLRFMPYQICPLVGISSQALSNYRTKLLYKIFKVKGGAKDFDLAIRSL